jgi:hypothetical protein
MAPASIVFDSGRAWRTLSKVFPDVRLSCATYDAEYSGAVMRADDWWRSETATERSLGEFERIRLYSSRGDIDP